MLQKQKEKKYLIVERNPNFIFLFEEWLKNYYKDYEKYSVKNVKDAIDLLEKNYFELIVISCKLECGSNGCVVLDFIKENKKEMWKNVVFSSSNDICNIEVKEIYKIPVLEQVPGAWKTFLDKQHGKKKKIKK